MQGSLRLCLKVKGTGKKIGILEKLPVQKFAWCLENGKGARQIAVPLLSSKLLLSEDQTLPLHVDI